MFFFNYQRGSGVSSTAVACAVADYAKFIYQGSFLGVAASGNLEELGPSVASRAKNILKMYTKASLVIGTMRLSMISDSHPNIVVSRWRKMTGS